MYRIPAPQVRLSTQTRTFTQGLASSALGNIRHTATQDLAIHGKAYETQSDAAFEAASEALLSIVDATRVKTAFDTEYQAVQDAIKVLEGEIPAEQDHPLVKHAVEYKQEANLARQLHPDLQAANTTKAADSLRDLGEQLADEEVAIANRYTKAIQSARKSFGAALCRTKDVGSLYKLAESHGLKFKNLIPSSWAIDFGDVTPTQATFDPYSKLHSPERTASVIVHQCRKRISADKAKRDRSDAAKMKDAHQQATDSTLNELKHLLGGNA